MAISKFKLAMKAIGGALNPFGSAAASVADYLLDVTNNALKSIDKSNKERIQAVLNTVKKVLAILRAIEWLIPTKWQTAYGKTLQAVGMVAEALADMEIGRNEPELIRQAFEEAVEAWKGPDDNTCVEM